jgi:NAD(P)-dependent dehydrogenase (short-subunit alcohol dehydrogenase family)
MAKIILITGASSGIGKATALQLIKEGHTVYGAARRVEKMQDLVEAGGHAIGMDVTDEAQIVAGVKQITDAHGRIDVLVNNAGYAVYGAVEDVPIDQARRQFEVNIFGLARITQEVLPWMRKQKDGYIVNMSSMGGKIFTPLGAWYHATKHALEGWSDCLRLEVEPFGIKVVIIEPGAIKTEFGDVLTGPLLETSGKGAYKEMTHKLAKAVKESYDKPNSASPPTVIAEVISKAISSRRPKTRYVKGKLAKPLLFVRRYFSDRFFQKQVMRMVK